MQCEYMVWLCSPAGERLAVLDGFVRLEYVRRVNDTGYRRGLFGVVAYPLTLVLPWTDKLPLRWLQRDARLEVWRGCGGRLLELDTETVWFVSRVVRRVLRSGERVVEVNAEPAIALLGRRIVAYGAGDTEAQCAETAAGDAMKAIVRENFGSGAGSGRDVSNWLRVEENLGDGAHVTRTFARRNVLDVLKDLAEASGQDGEPLFFDVVAPTLGAGEQVVFRTYGKARGSDHSFGNSAGTAPVVLSVETGTLADVVRQVDWHAEVTYVYVAGQGAQDARAIVEVGDTTRAGVVPFGRREVLCDARHVAVQAALEAEGKIALRQGEPRDEFEATLVSRAPWAVYGIHWRFGDVVSAEVAEEIVRCRIDSVRVVVERGREEVTAALRVDMSGQVGTLEGTDLTRQVAGLAAHEQEHVHQQVQRQGVPAGEYVVVPSAAQIVAYGVYEIAGTLDVASGGELRVVG